MFTKIGGVTWTRSPKLSYPGVDVLGRLYEDLEESSLFLFKKNSMLRVNHGH